MTTRVLFIQGGGKGAHAVDTALVEALQRALGREFEVHFPRMPGEAEPKVEPWKQRLATQLSRLRGRVILVGHSVGGAIVLRYLAEEQVVRPIAGVFLLAAPAWDAERWNFDDLELPRDAAKKLALIPRLFLYHCRDDAVVPFAHLALHRARLPQAVTREVEAGGHQFAHGLAEVAADIRGDEAT